MDKCDLHIHSVFSDSDETLEQIFEAAKEKGLFCIAIADHDTVLGQVEAAALSKAYNIEYVAAIELSARFADSEVHILGYFIDPNNEALKSSLKDMRKFRQDRLLAMADKLNSLGVRVDKDELFLRIKDVTPTRLHLALYLVDKGEVGSLWEAFRKYLSPGAPAYVSRLKYSAEEAIRLIKNVGGLAFLAHPHFLSQNSWIEKLIVFGIDGLEVVYPRYSPQKIASYKNIAARYNLLKSGGSDAHGSYKKFTKIAGVTVPYQWVEEMKARLKPAQSFKSAWPA